MDIAMILIVSTFWLTSTAYVINWLYKNGEVTFGSVLISLIMGPILVFFIKDSEKEKEHPQITSDLESHHIKWFRTMGEINRQRFPTWFRSIPPPPPMSRVDRARSERDEAIRTARERIQPPNRRPNKTTKDFKFFH